MRLFQLSTCSEDIQSQYWPKKKTEEERDRESGNACFVAAVSWKLANEPGPD